MSSIMATEPRKTGGKRALKRVGRSSKPKFLDVTGWICLIWLAILVFVAIFGKWLAPHDPQALDQANQLLYPNADNWLGTDTLGRDIFSRIVAGVGPTLYGPLLIVVIAGVGGTVLAVVAAWWGGWVDAIISRAMDIIFAFPGIILAVLAVAMLGRGMVAPVVALSIATIPMVGRIVRSPARRE
uniref:ABC transporter permease n=1 Tax=Galactobacter sp. TaxID=2676125 RepID=UPI00345D03F2